MGSPSMRLTYKANAAVLANEGAVWLAVCGDRRGVVHGESLRRAPRAAEICVGRERDSDSSGEPVSLVGGRRRIQAAGRLGSQQGLKFGIHIVRGIPRQVVKENLPIVRGRTFTPPTLPTTEPCPWDEGNWGVKDNAAGQAYYDSMLKLYAGGGLDFIKVDCISDHPFRPTEIKQIAEAIRKTGRPIVLSLSPGPTQLETRRRWPKYAQMWRISDDHWDGWDFEHKAGDGEFPFGVRDAFDRLAKWFRM
jgi:hypothetical protein